MFTAIIIHNPKRKHSAILIIFKKGKNLQHCTSFVYSNCSSKRTLPHYGFCMHVCGLYMAAFQHLINLWGLQIWEWCSNHSAATEIKCSPKVSFAICMDLESLQLINERCWDSQRKMLGMNPDSSLNILYVRNTL